MGYKIPLVKGFTRSPLAPKPFRRGFITLWVKLSPFTFDSKGRLVYNHSQS
jgi:hypothetical protein